MKGSHLALYLLWMAFSGKNPICNTVKAFFSLNTWFSWCLACFSLKSLNQNVLNLFLQIFSEGFFHLTSFYYKRIKNDLISTFKTCFSFCFLFCFCWPRFFLPIGALFQNRTKRYITNPFWDKMPQLMEGKLFKLLRQLFALKQVKN